MPRLCTDPADKIALLEIVSKCTIEVVDVLQVPCCESLTAPYQP